MITFKSPNDVLDFINSLDGCGLIITDDEELQERLAQLTDDKSNAEITGNSAAFVIKFKDLLATGTISDWITRAEMEGVRQPKIESARRQLALISNFQSNHRNQCQMPD